MKRILIILLLAIFGMKAVKAQELNMKITINSIKIEGVNKDVFESLQDALTRFVNGRKWTDVVFFTNERIDCAMILTLDETVGSNTYKGNIQVTSTRPVYNSTYTTPIFNFKDKDVQFSYQQGENLQYSDNNINNNLTAIMAFYVYTILGLDFDSFSLNEGKKYFEKALNVANNAQNLNEKGWEIFGNNKNRYALAIALTEDSSGDFHTMWYNYHRIGLDDMAANQARARTAIEQTVTELDKIKKARPSSPLLSMYSDTKLDELLNVYSEASVEEKKEAYKILEAIYPTKRSVLQKIK